MEREKYRGGGEDERVTLGKRGGGYKKSITLRATE